MNILIIYDSVFGNTEKIAQALGSVLREENVSVLRAADVKINDFKNIDLLIAGSPTRAFRPTKSIKDLIKKLPENSLNKVKFAVFDTRLDVSKTDSKLLKALAKRFGYAAEFLSKLLVKKGGKEISQPQWFFVKDSEGPLEDGEITRAENWAKGFKSL